METYKTLIIMRGLPGSGKSTLAHKLGEQGVVYSTDDFFMVEGKYIYNSQKIAEYHNKNQYRTKEAMEKGVAIVVVDNTNMKLWYMRKYVEFADQYGYKIKIQESETEWAWNAYECAKRNSHNVPYQSVKRMIDSYEKFSDLDEIRKAEDPFQNKRRGYKK